jgi:hypothetical protein
MRALKLSRTTARKLRSARSDRLNAVSFQICIDEREISNKGKIVQLFFEESFQFAARLSSRWPADHSGGSGFC